MRSVLSCLPHYFPVSLMVIFGTIILVTNIASADSAGQDAEQIQTSMAQQAKITIVQAISTASKAQPGTVLKAELEKEHGPLMWEVKIISDDGTIHEIHVDGERGEILDLHAENDNTEKTDSSIHAGASDNKTQDADPAPKQSSSTTEPSTQKP